MDTTRTPLPGIPAGLFFVIIALTYKVIPKTALGSGRNRNVMSHF